MSSSGLTCGAAGTLAAMVDSCSSALAAVAGDVLVEQRRSEVGRRRERLVELEHSSSSSGCFGLRLVFGALRRGGAQVLLLGDHLFDRRQDVFHRWFAAGRLHGRDIAYCGG